MTSWVKELASGFVVGAANIIPGVSGGTLMLILGLYGRVMSALSQLKAQIIPRFLHHLSKVFFSKEHKTHLLAIAEIFKTIDGFFLLRLATGAVLAIVLLSDLMKYLLTEQLSNTYAFFFGLILLSTLFTVGLIKSRKTYHIVPLLAGIAVTVLLSISVDPAQSAQNKSDHYQSLYESNISSAQDATSASESRSFSYLGHYSLSDFTTSAMSGAVSVSAMILPGLSGSLVLILTGQYYEIISAVSGLRTLQIDYALFLMTFALGMVLGILLFARLIHYVFNRFHDTTMFFLIGLMAGSLYTLWPFKKSVTLDQYIRTPEGIELLNDAVVHTNINILPPSLGGFLWAVLFCAAGVTIMLLFSRLDKKSASVPRN